MVKTTEQRNIIRIVNHYFTITNNVRINNENLITVEGNCSNRKGFGQTNFELPVSFNEVYGSFICNYGWLTTLKGSPKKVGRLKRDFTNFSVANNRLTNLIGGPIEVTGTYNAEYNPLTSLEGLALKFNAILLSYDKDLPLLRLVDRQFALGKNAPGQLTIIIRNIPKELGLKKMILKCQKELIENGFIGNARW